MALTWEKFIEKLLDEVQADPLYNWPIGSIYMSAVSTDPGTLFGGTWSAWGAGRVPVGIDANQTEFDTVEETGGYKTHTLQTTEIPAHGHSFKTSTGGSDPWGISAPSNTGTAVSLPGYVGDTGGGGAHNNLQPYIVCYMWKRTA